MTLALDAPNVLGLAHLMFWRWFHGMAVKLAKLPHRQELKIVLVVKDVKQHVRQIS